MAHRIPAPIHPGEVLQEEFLRPLHLSEYRVAKETSVPPRRINEIVRGSRAISADTALRLARYFGTSERFWLNLQSRYELETEKDRLGTRLEREVKKRDAISWCVYKCNSRNNPYRNFGDWRNFFDNLASEGRAAAWGETSVIFALRDLKPGDMALAYQTDRNELVGLVRMVRSMGGRVLFEAVEEFGVKVRSLKEMEPALGTISAFRRGQKTTLCSITEAEARMVMDVARRMVAVAV